MAIMTKISKLKRTLRDRIVGKDASPLPVGMLVVIFAINLFAMMTWTSVMSYLPKLVKHWGSSEVDAGHYAGIIAASLFISRIIFSLPWGILSDLKSPKLTLTGTTVGLCISTLAFGFSYNFYVALFTRLSQGLFCAELVAGRALITRFCDETNVAFGLSTLGMAVALGIVIGPSLSGFLVFPVEQYPKLFDNNNFFTKFPVLLPNLLISLGFGISLLFINKYVPSCEKRDDATTDSESLEKENTCLVETNGEMKEKDISITNYGSTNSNEKKVETNQKSSGCFKVLITKFSKSKFGRLIRLLDAWKVCLLFFNMGLICNGFSEVLPVFLATSPNYHGLELSPSKIGSLLLIAACIQVVLQIFIVANLVNRLGITNCQILVNSIQGVLYALTPTITLYSNRYLIWICCCIYLVIIRIGTELFFVNVNMFSNYAVPEDLQGSANGLSMALLAAGSAIGASLFGLQFSWSLKNIKDVDTNEHALGFPFNQYFTFFTMAILSFLSACFASSLRYIERKGRQDIYQKLEDSDETKC